MKKDTILGEWVVLDNWSTLIEEAHGKGEEIFKNTEKKIKEIEVPDAKIEKVELSTGIISGLFSKTKNRIYLEVSNEDLTDYGMYIGARDYGKQLDVQWYLIRRKAHKGLSDKLKDLPQGVRRGITGLNVFEQQDLTAYVTSVHHALLGSVKELMLSLDQDPSEIDRKSKGFLGVS